MQPVVGITHHKWKWMSKQSKCRRYKISLESVDAPQKPEDKAKARCVLSQKHLLNLVLISLLPKVGSWFFEWLCWTVLAGDDTHKHLKIQEEREDEGNECCPWIQNIVFRLKSQKALRCWSLMYRNVIAVTCGRQENILAVKMVWTKSGEGTGIFSSIQECVDPQCFRVQSITSHHFRATDERAVLGCM